MNSTGSKPLTSPAMRASNAEASKRVIGPMPLAPASRASQVARVPTASGGTSPTPVQTTRRLGNPSVISDSVRDVLIDVVDGVLHRGDALRLFVRDLDHELLFARH